MNYFDLHCDTIGELSGSSMFGKSNGDLRKNGGQLDLTRTQQFSSYAQVFALFCGTKPVKNAADAHKRFTRLLHTAEKQLADNRDILQLCQTAEEFQNIPDGKQAAFLSIEGAELLQSQEDIDRAIEAGVRIITLTWNHRSIYGCGALTDNNAGLTENGRSFAKQVTEKGVFLDVSHLSERGFWELFETVSTPLIATHSNSKTVCQHPRNLTDDQFMEILRRGGIVGINLYVPFLTQEKTAACEDVLRHIEHFCALGGAKQLCIGADWDGCDRFPDGISDVQGIRLLAETMARHGYSEQLIEDILYNNANRFVLTNFS